MTPLAAGISAAVAIVLGSAVVLADEHPADVCLEVSPGAVSVDEWSSVAVAVEEALISHTALFPDPRVQQEATRLDIASGHLQEPAATSSCLQPGSEWSARFGRGFLEAGADRMLAEAPTTPGIDSDVSLEWYPSETRLRTTLVFAGPLDIPNGTCWIDDALTVDRDSGTVRASSDRGVKTSPFAEGACGRFFDHLPEGGAGEQAVTLLPAVVDLADGGALRFVAEDVLVAEDAVTVLGRLERD
jgi:hypothetical protein